MRRTTVAFAFTASLFLLLPSHGQPPCCAPDTSSVEEKSADCIGTQADRPVGSCCCELGTAALKESQLYISGRPTLNIFVLDYCIGRQRSCISRTLQYLQTAATAKDIQAKLYLCGFNVSAKMPEVQNAVPDNKRKFQAQQPPFLLAAVQAHATLHSLTPELFPFDAYAAQKQPPLQIGDDVVNLHLLDRCVFAPQRSAGLERATVTTTGTTTPSSTSSGSPTHRAGNDDPSSNFGERHEVFEIFRAKLQATTAIQRKPAELALERSAVTFLGTGSAMPSRFRNVSAILLEFCRHAVASACAPTVPDQTTELGVHGFPAHGSEKEDECRGFLLDAGEGTLSQLRRYSKTTSAFQRQIANLDAVFISHKHADHHIGLIQLLVMRTRLVPSRPILLLVPAALEKWIRFWDSNIEPLGQLDVRTLDRINENDLKIVDDITGVQLSVAEAIHIHEHGVPKGCFALRIAVPLTAPSLDQMPNPHVGTKWREAILQSANLATDSSCFRACGKRHSNPFFEDREPNRADITTGSQLAASTVDYWVAVYSGDTRPCERIQMLADSSNLLIHEATFEDDFQAEAVAKNHSTVSEALRLAAASKTAFVMLNHFSQRYRSVKIASDDAAVLGLRFGTSLDGMRIPLAAFGGPAATAAGIPHADALAGSLSVVLAALDPLAVEGDRPAKAAAVFGVPEAEPEAESI